MNVTTISLGKDVQVTNDERLSADPHTLEVREVAWDEPTAVALRAAMTAEVLPRYADRSETMPRPAQMEVDPLEAVYTAVAYLGDRGVGHIALRRVPGGLFPTALEIKRTFVDPAVRGRGVGRLLLDAVEQAARRAGARRVVLQTGDRQPEAAALYTRAGYSRIPIFGLYLALPYSLCFEKVLVGGDDE